MFYWINIYTKHWRFLVKISKRFIYISFCLQRGQGSLCLRPLWVFSLYPYSPPSLIIFVRFCCGLFATVVFPFWQLARFVYLCLFKSNAEPAWLALPWLGCAGPFKTVCFAGLQVMPWNFGARRRRAKLLALELARRSGRSMARSQSTSLARFVTHYVRTLLKPGSTFATFLCTHTHTNTF